MPCHLPHQLSYVPNLPDLPSTALSEAPAVLPFLTYSTCAASPGPLRRGFFGRRAARGSVAAGLAEGSAVCGGCRDGLQGAGSSTEAVRLVRLGGRSADSG